MRQYIDTAQDISGNALPFATCKVLNYPSGTNAAIFSDNGLTPIGTSIVSADVTGQFSFFVADGDYTLQLLNNGTLYKTQTPVSMFDGAAQVTFADTGAANAYAIANNALEKALRVGLRCSFQALNSATGPSTLAYNTLAAKPIVVPGGAAAGANTLIATGIYAVEYDGASWQLRTAPSSPSFPQTAQEAAAGIQPANTAYFGVPWLWIRREGCVCDGITDDTTAFNKCLTIAAASGAPQTAFLIDGPTYINSGVTIPSNVQIVFVGRGTLKPGAAHNIQLGQLPSAGLWQIFDYSAGGTVTFATSRMAEVWGEWWGANGDGVTNVANDVAINAAQTAIWNAGAGTGGTVRLGCGAFFTSAVITVQNTCSIRGMGTGSGGTLIKPKASWAGGNTLINATLATGNQEIIESRLENLRIDGGGIGAIVYLVYSESWQNHCGLYNCTLQNFQQNGFYYTIGHGGAACLDIEHCDFFPNDVNNAVGVFCQNTSSSGWMKLNISNSTFGTATGNNGVVGIWVDNRVLLDVQGVDVELMEYGIQLTTAAQVTGCGVGAGGQTPPIAGNALFRCAGSWTGPLPGNIDVSGVQLGGWSNMVSDANRAYVCAALQPYDNHLVWPPNLSKPVGVAIVTGGGVPVISKGFGVCSTANNNTSNGTASIVNTAAGEQTITFSITMDGSSSFYALATSLDSGAPQIAAVAATAQTMQIFTKSGAGAATNAGAFMIQIFHTP